MLSRSLQVGDLLISRNDEWKPIVSIERVQEIQTTYNFEVFKNHDYFVGKIGWLVHNQSKSLYQDITTGNSTKNIQTDVTKTDFVDSLTQSGYTSSTSKDGIVTILEKGTTKYTVRDTAKSINTPTAEVFQNGVLVKKIRLSP